MKLKFICYRIITGNSVFIHLIYKFTKTSKINLYSLTKMQCIIIYSKKKNTKKCKK